MAGWLLAKVTTSSGRSLVVSNPPNVLLGHCGEKRDICHKNYIAGHKGVLPFRLIL